VYTYLHTYVHTYYINTYAALTAAAAPTTSVYAQHEIVFRNSNCLVNRQEEGPADEDGSISQTATFVHEDGLLESESFEARKSSIVLSVCRASM
jgi:hypothetical protein